MIFNLPSSHYELKKSALFSIVPWLRYVNLSGTFSLPDDDRDLHIDDDSRISWCVFSNLLYLTDTFGDTCSKVIESMWTALLHDPTENELGSSVPCLGLLVDLMLLAALRIGRVRQFQSIAVFIARTNSRVEFLNRVISHLSPRSFIFHPGIETKVTNVLLDDQNCPLFTVDPLSYQDPGDKQIKYAKGHIAAALLVNFIAEIERIMVYPHMPLLFSIIFAQLDEHADISEIFRLLLVNIVQYFFLPIERSTELKKRGLLLKLKNMVLDRSSTN